MEVHHHAHTSRKKWKHYFWEFLMLFLAVFCGFLAEYQLEHKIEKDRERQYILSLVEDLKVDTSMINGLYIAAQDQKKITDSILEMLYYQQPLDEPAIARLYTLQFSVFMVTAEFEDRTKSQLKNSGAMRLVRKKNVNDSILAYWRRTETANMVSDRITEKQNEISNLAAKIFHTKYIIPGDAPASAPKGIRPGARLIAKDPVQLDEYANLHYTRRARINSLMERFFHMKERAVRLMELIKEEYHLK